MRPLRDMETIQIEVTNSCNNMCSNCTRLVGHNKVYFMELDKIEQAVDSLIGYNGLIGIMGGEPLLHPKFTEICEIIKSKVPFMKAGLWTSLPVGYEYYNKIICETFGNIFINDHTREDILHHPVLVSSREFEIEDRDKWYLIDKCWVQNSWSACINPKGAFFCEVAGAISLLINGKSYWKVEKDWWKRNPIDYVEQMKEYCTLCGCALPLLKRYSNEVIDDISPGMYELIKDKSKKIKKGLYKIHDFSMYIDNRPIATYKDIQWRNKIAARYNIFLMINSLNYTTPYLKGGINA